jgi:hypothetical protein
MRSFSITVCCTVLLLTVTAVRVHAQGQQGSGSPYSAYGFGDLFGNTQVTQALMGGVGVALAEPFSVSQVNPATYTALGRPVFEAGGVARFIRFDSEANGLNGNRTDLLGLSIGVPFARNKWGVALGINPVSDVGYRITDTRALPDGAGDVTFQYSGNGGLNRAYFGAGRVLWQNNDTLDRGSKLAIGANFNYLFGTIEEVRKAYYPVSGNYYNSNASSSLTLRAPTGNVGLLYTGDLIGLAEMKAKRDAKRRRIEARNERLEGEWVDAGKDPAKFKPLPLPTRPVSAWRLRAGAAVELPTQLQARHTGLVNSFITASSGVELNVDTAWYQEGGHGTVDVPPLFSVGVGVYDPRWNLSVEYRRRDWSALEMDVDGLERTNRLGAGSAYALGASFKPGGDIGGRVWERITYRAGLRYGDDYLVVADKQLHEGAISAGLSLPLMAITTRSRLNVGVEVGQRGDTADGLVRERFTNVFVGVTITPEVWDQWFKKRRIE